MEIIITSCANTHGKIPPIKAVRVLTGLGLKDAKDVIDEVFEGRPQTINVFDHFSIDDIGYELDAAGVRFVVPGATADSRLGLVIHALAQYKQDATVAEVMDSLVSAQKVMAL